MFKNRSLPEVVFYAIAGAVMVVLLALTAEKTYTELTRPPGHECKEGDTKPQQPGENLESFCENGYWEYVPSGYWPPPRDKKK
jgi:hypothetical protein